MLADFQQAMADCIARPALCLQLRADPAALDGAYDLTPREKARLLGMVAHPGMSAACTVYRMNRIAPLAMNLRATLQALGPDARGTVQAYWHDHPRGIAHFHLESARFCAWLASRPEAAQPGVAPALQDDAAELNRALAEAEAT